MSNFDDIKEINDILNRRNYILDERIERMMSHIKPLLEISDDGKTLISVNTEMMHPNFCIMIPEGVENILPGVFKNCGYLQKIMLPCSLKEIPHQCFEDCIYLDEVIIPFNSELKKIGQSAFKNCKSLQKITLPESLEHISEKAFYGCSSLKNIVFPEKLVNIESEAFAFTSISELFIPKSLQIIGPGICRGCKELKEIKVEENHFKFKDFGCNIICLDGGKDYNYIIQGCSTSVIPEIKNIEILNKAFSGINLEQDEINNRNIKYVGQYAFADSNIKSAILMNVEIIKDFAFSNCKNLDTIVIGKEISIIEENAFKDSSVKTIRFQKKTDLSKIDFNVFKNSNINTFIFESKKTLESKYNEDRLGYLEDLLCKIPNAKVIIEDIEDYPDILKTYESDIENTTLDYYLSSKGFSATNNVYNKRNEIEKENKKGKNFIKKLNNEIEK